MDAQDHSAQSALEQSHEILLNLRPIQLIPKSCPLARFPLNIRQNVALPQNWHRILDSTATPRKAKFEARTIAMTAAMSILIKRFPENSCVVQEGRHLRRLLTP
jgi:hypothetical protein